MYSFCKDDCIQFMLMLYSTQSAKKQTNKLLEIGTRIETIKRADYSSKCSPLHSPKLNDRKKSLKAHKSIFLWFQNCQLITYIFFSQTLPLFVINFGLCQFNNKHKVKDWRFYVRVSPRHLCFENRGRDKLSNQVYVYNFGDTTQAQLKNFFKTREDEIVFSWNFMN